MTDRTLALLGGAHLHLRDHLARVRALGWRIGLVHDRNPARRARLCADLGAAPLEDPAALDAATCAGVVVCSETAHHAADIGAALTAGLPVFTEKPLACSAESAWHLAELADETGQLLHMACFLRTQPALGQLKQAIDEGVFGQVSQADMLFAPAEDCGGSPDPDDWTRDPALACYGGFADEVVHVLDTLQWLVGPIGWARADIDDDAAAWRCCGSPTAPTGMRRRAEATSGCGWT